MDWKEKKQNEELKRSNSLKATKNKATDDFGFEIPGLEEIKRTKSMKADKAKPAATTKDLKKKAATKVSELKPKNKERQEVGEIIKSYHDILEAEDARIFANRVDTVLHKKRYSQVGASKRDKRITEAIKRKNLAERITEYDSVHAQDNIKYFDADKKDLTKLLKQFMKLSGQAQDMSDDKKFVEHLEINYKFCETAEIIKKCIDDAVEGGYMPEGFDMEALQERIAGYKELKVYLDHRKELMKSPYYQYFASEDVTYTDDQIDIAIKYTEDAQLKYYMQNLKVLRSIKFKRDKGIASVSKRVSQTAKKEKELLKTRGEKRELLSKLEDHALNFRGNAAYHTKDYDARYTEELFRKRLAQFDRLKVSDLHFKNIKNIIDHFEENDRIFEQSRDFQNLLVNAVKNGVQIPDDRLLNLRAKIRVFTFAERFCYQLQRDMLSHREEILHEKTYDEISNEILNNLYNKSAWENEDGYPPVPGSNLEKYYNSMVKRYKKDHKDRKKNIRLMWGMMHPVAEQNEDGEDAFVAGEISENELDQRSKNYQKNALLNDYIVDTENYASFVYTNIFNPFFEEYSKKVGFNAKAAIKSIRVFPRYVTGMSSDQLKAVVKTLTRGTPEEKEKFWKGILDMAQKTDMREMDSEDVGTITDNIAYKYNMQGMLLNLNEIAEFLGDKKLKNMSNYLYTYGTGHAYNISSITIALRRNKLGRAIAVSDMFDNEYRKDAEALAEQIEENDGKYDKNGIKISNEDMWDGALRIIKAMETCIDARISDDNKNRYKNKDYKNTPEVTKYQEMLNNGLWEILKKEDAAALKAYMSDKRQKVSENPGLSEDKYTTAKEYEDLFTKIMDFDLKQFEFKSFKDMMTETKENPDRLLKCMEIVKLSGIAKGLIGKYPKTAKVKGKMTGKLNADHLKEISARCDMLSSASALMEVDKFIDSPLLAEFESLDDMLHQPPQFYEDKKTEASRKKDRKTVEEINKIQAYIEKLNGYDLNTDFSVLENGYRSANEVNVKKTDPKTVLNILKGTESVLKDTDIAKIEFRFFSAESIRTTFHDSFDEKKMSVSAREALLSSTRSVQFKNNELAHTISRFSKNGINDYYLALKEIPLSLQTKLGADTAKDLAAFMTDGEIDEAKKAKIRSFAEKYLNKETRFEAIDEMTRDILSIKTDFGKATDSDLAVHAHELEKLGKKAYAYRNILKANPEYADRLKVLNKNGRETDYDVVTRRLSKLFLISDYYRARKLVLTNPYYILHESSEIGTELDPSLNAEQRRIAELIRLSVRCADRMEGNTVLERDDDDVERILDKYETDAANAAFLTGRPDESLMDASLAYKNHNDIREYISTNGIGREKIYQKDVLKFDFSKQTPESAKYKTKAVENYINATKVYYGIADATNGGHREALLNERQLAVYKKLVAFVLSRKGNRASFMDPKTGEDFSLKTDPVRLPTDLVLLFDNLPEEEVFDIMEGLYIGSDPQLDLKDPVQFEYAKNRYLQSAKKYFDNMLGSVKRFEKTYGTLPADIPIGVFIQSLGSEGVASLPVRMRFSQNIAEATAEKTCRSKDGKEITFAEMLAEQGLISKEDLNKSITWGPNYYQTLTLSLNCYFNGQTQFVDAENETGFSQTSQDLTKYAHIGRVHTNEGPSISMSKQHNIWKKAIEQGDVSIIGLEDAVKFQKDRLGVYSSSERKTIKKQREKDAQLVTFCNAYLDDRAEVLLKTTLDKLGIKTADKNYNELEEAIKKLIVFHPGMYPSVKKAKGKKAVPKGENEFYGYIKDYLGIGVEEKDKKQKKIAAFEAFRDSLKTIIPANNIDDIMNNNVRHDNDALEGSNLLKLETGHRMYLTLQDMMSEPGAKDMFTKETYRDARNVLQRALKYETFRATMKSRMYLECRDLGSHYSSAAEIRFSALQYLREYELNYGTLDEDIMDEEHYALLKDTGIRLDKPLIFEEVKAIVETKQKEEQKSEEKKTGENKTEEKKAPVEEKNTLVQDRKAPIEEKKHGEREVVREEAKPEIKIAELRKIYNKAEFDKHVEALKQAGIPVPADRDKLVELRTPHYGKEFTLIKLDGTETTEQTWLDNANPIMKEHYDWMMQYFRVNDPTLDLNEDLDYVPEKLEVQNYNVSIKLDNMNNRYEQQDHQNCFCCVGTALTSVMYSKRKKTNDYLKRGNQFQMRNYRPLVRKYDKSIENAGVELKQYGKIVKDMDAYCGKDKRTAGNLFEEADYMLDTLKNNETLSIRDVCVNSIKFTYPGENLRKDPKHDAKAHNMREIFKKTIADALSKGDAIGAYRVKPFDEHYITITGINGDKLTVYDSSGYMNEPDTITIDKFFEDTSTVELNWLSDMPSPEELTEEYSNLTYDEQKGFGVKESDPDSVRYVGHTKGVTVRKNLNDVKKDSGMEGIVQTIYIPDEKAQIETQTIEEFYAEHKDIDFDAPDEPVTQTTTTQTKTTETKNEEIKTEEIKSGEEVFYTTMSKLDSITREEVKPETVKQPSNIVTTTRKKSDEKKNVPRKSEEKKAAPQSDSYNMADYEKDLTEAYTKGTFRGKKIPSSVLKAFKPMYEAYKKASDDKNAELADAQFIKMFSHLSGHKLFVANARNMADLADSKNRLATVNAAKDEYPEITVNGKKYTLYASDKYLNRLAAKKLHLSKKDAASLDKAMKQYMELNLQKAAAPLILKGKGDAALQLKVESLRIDSLLGEIQKTIDNLTAKSKPIKGESQSSDKEIAEYNDAYKTAKAGSKDMLDKYIKSVVKDEDSRKKYKWDDMESIKTIVSDYAKFLELQSEEDVPIDADQKRMLQTLLLDENHCNDVEQHFKCREIDKLFQMILGYRIDNLDFDNPVELLESEKLSDRLMLNMMSNLSGDIFDFYEKMMDREGVYCALDKDQLKEVKARWQLMRQVAVYAEDYPELYLNAKKLGKDPSELMKDIKSNLTGDYNFGDDARATLDRIREEEFGLDRSVNYCDDARQKLNSRLGNSPEKDYNENVAKYVMDEPFDEAVKRADKIIDYNFGDSEFSREEVEAIKTRQKELMGYGFSIKYNVDEALLKRCSKAPGIDIRGLHALLRPVNVNDKGEPLTEQDRQNLRLNNEEAEGILKETLSARKPFLDRVAKEAEELMFTDEQLNDPDFLYQNKERALRHLSFFHNLLNVYHSHAEYYQLHADEKARVIMHVLVKSSDYANYSCIKIQQALLLKGMDTSSLNVGGSSLATVGVIPYYKGYERKEIMGYNDKARALNPEKTMQYAATYKAFVSGYQNLEETTNKMRIQLMEADTPQKVKDIATAERLALLDQYGLDKEEITSDEQMQNTVYQLNELTRKKDDPEYIKKMLAKINDFRAVVPIAGDITNDVGLKYDDEESVSNLKSAESKQTQADNTDWAEDAETEELENEHRLEFEADIEGLDEFGEIPESSQNIAELNELNFKELESNDEVTIDLTEAEARVAEEERLQREAEENKKAEAQQKKADEKKRKEDEKKARLSEPGLELPGDFLSIAAQEKGMKGSFSRKFNNSVDAVIDSIEKVGFGTEEDARLYKQLGINSSVEMIHIGGRPLSIYVRDNYNYGGNDLNVLKKYAALIAAKKEAPVIFFGPKIVDGELTYVPRSLVLKIDEKNKNADLKFRERGLKTEDDLSNDSPLFVSEKTGRAYRQIYKKDTYGFAEAEAIADRLKTAKSSSDTNYSHFVTSFTQYYEAVERFAYVGLEHKQITTLRARAKSASDYAKSYLGKKKAKSEIQHIAEDAIKVLQIHLNAIDKALDGDAFKNGKNEIDEKAKVTFAQIFGDAKK